MEGEPESRLAFRKADRARRHGAFQLYVGRTSPLELRRGPGGKVTPKADKTYQALSRSLFSPHREAELAGLEGEIREHLSRCRAEMSSTLVEGEAVVHNRLVRRYSMRFRNGDPFVAVDCEVKCGFRAVGRRTGTDAKRAYIGRAADDERRSRSTSPLGKLDAIGILPDGSVALVEVKKRGGSVAEAVRQAENHVYNFEQLLRSPDTDVAGMLNRMVEQKEALGLIRPGAYRAAPTPDLVPVVAVPDDEGNWMGRWTRVSKKTRSSSGYLGSLRFWRLSDAGEILEEHRP